MQTTKRRLHRNQPSGSTQLDLGVFGSIGMGSSIDATDPGTVWIITEPKRCWTSERRALGVEPWIVPRVAGGSIASPSGQHEEGEITMKFGEEKVTKGSNEVNVSHFGGKDTLQKGHDWVPTRIYTK